MGTVNLTIGEREVLEAIVKVIQEERSFNLEDINLPSAPVRGFVSSLQRKGMLTMNNGEYYYDGQVTDAGLHEVENSKVNNEQEVKQSNNSKNMATKANKTVKVETKKAKTARKVGEHHPNHPTWIWTEYAEGKFDWRTNPADKKQGQRTDKVTTSAKKEIKPVKEEKKELTIEEFVALPKTNKKPSEAQAKALKLINKGYRITADKTFFEKDDSREACNWDSVVALFRRYGIEYIPEGLVKSL